VSECEGRWWCVVEGGCAPALQALDAEESAMGLEVLGVSLHTTKDL
jgi:hypothetical protein